MSKANISGNHGEQLIAHELDAIGYSGCSAKERKQILLAMKYDLSPTDLLLPKTYYRQLPLYESIYRAPFKADMTVITASGEMVLFESKWQSAAGSVDEKLPFWLMTLDALPVKTVLVLMGGGYRPAAEEWCRANSDNTAMLTTGKELKLYIQRLGEKA